MLRRGEQIVLRSIAGLVGYDQVLDGVVWVADAGDHAVDVEFVPVEGWAVGFMEAAFARQV